MERHDVLLE